VTNKTTIIKGRRFSDVRIACKLASLDNHHDISIRGNQISNSFKLNQFYKIESSEGHALILQKVKYGQFEDPKPYKFVGSGRFWTNPSVLPGI
jgi:hypothetical protein